MTFHPVPPDSRRNSGFFLATLVGAMAIGLVLSPVRPVDAGTPGSTGDTTADRELGQTDFTHTMFDFGGAAALSGLSGVAVDSSGHLYVSDSINNRILGWTSAGAFANGDPAQLVIGQPDFYSYRCDDGTAVGDVEGTGADSLCGPEGSAVDGAGNLYVADTIDSRVLEFARPFLSGVTSGQSAAAVFGHHGSFVATTCNDGGASASNLCDPRGLALDAAGNLYIADSGESRVLEYNTPLNPSSGETGAGDTIADAVFGQNGIFGTRGAMMALPWATSAGEAAIPCAVRSVSPSTQTEIFTYPTPTTIACSSTTRR